MLVVSRRKHEQIFIGENKDIVITICRIDPTSVRIGIEADPSIPIVRDDAVDTEPRPRQVSIPKSEETLVESE